MSVLDEIAQEILDEFCIPDECGSIIKKYLINYAAACLMDSRVREEMNEECDRQDQVFESDPDCYWKTSL